MSKTIFMIHGMWGGPWYWQSYISFFEEKGYRCIATTLRHHNVNPQDSPPAELGTTSILDYAFDLEQEIKRLDEKPIIMGHSMGGMLAQILGSRQLAKKLVLLAPASPAGILALSPSVIKSFSEVLVRPGFWKRPHRLSFEKAVYSMLHLLPEKEQKEVYQRFIDESGKAVAEIGFWWMDKNKATAVNEKEINCPVLVLAG
ncbi:MAG TPA: alpha/beta hydrolase, partial [Calditrichaeota bacterium]|nr:alpha/beta hydrolase [Calditrichota bacterium]